MVRKPSYLSREHLITWDEEAGGAVSPGRRAGADEHLGAGRGAVWSACARG